MKELIEKFPSGSDILSLSERELDSVLLKIVTARADGNGLDLPKYLSLGELENIYSVGLSLPSAQLSQINENLMASYQRLLSGDFFMPAPGQPTGVVTVTPRGRRGLPPEPSLENRPLLDWTGGARVTLAVAFTDIVDSTVLGLELGDALMGELQRKHFARSAELLIEKAGRQIKTMGDSVMAVFRSVGAAVDYALALQRDPGTNELRVRVGIHTGPVDVVGEDIGGKEVALAKRVVDAITGAEIWLSDRAKEDIDGAGTHRFEGWQWQPHEVDLKSFGHARLWSLLADPSGKAPRSTNKSGSQREPALKISSGEAGPYFQTRGRNLYATIRTLNLKLDNTSQSQAITGIKVSVLSIEPQSEYEGPWILAENLTLAAGDSCFIPFVSFQEADNATGYSTTRYERSATFFEILSTHTQPKPPRDVPQFITVRATGIGSAPRDYRCKIWVDRPDGRLRIADTANADAAPSRSREDERRAEDIRRYFAPELTRIVARQIYILGRAVANFVMTSVEQPSPGDRWVSLKPAQPVLYPDAPEFANLSVADATLLIEFYNSVQEITDFITGWIENEPPPPLVNAWNVLMQRTQHSLELGKAAVQRFCPERQFDAKIPAGGTLADRIDAAIAPVKPALDAHIARFNAKSAAPKPVYRQGQHRRIQ